MVPYGLPYNDVHWGAAKGIFQNWYSKSSRISDFDMRTSLFKLDAFKKTDTMFKANPDKSRSPEPAIVLVTSPFSG